MFDRIRKSATTALLAQDELLDALRDYHKHSVQDRLARPDVFLLQRLVLRNIYPVAAFEVLVRHDTSAAIEVLLQGFVGRDLEPDREFNELVFELKTMLGDLAAVRGEPALRALVTHEQFNQPLLEDPRFLVCLGAALNLDIAKTTEWLKKIA